MVLRRSPALPVLLLCALLQTLPSDARDASSAETQTMVDFEAGHERMRRTARHYEVVGVDTSYHRGSVSRRRRSAGLQEQAGIFQHPEKSSFTVNAFGKRMHLDLRLQKDLLPEGFEYQYYKENGDLVREKSVEHCYYQGEVLGLGSAAMDSYVAVSTCNGLTGVFGYGHGAGKSSGFEQYHIQPFLSSPAPNGTHLHAVYRPRDLINEVDDEGDESDAMECTGDLPVSSKYKAEAPGLDLLQRQAEHASARVRRQAATNATNSNATVVPPPGAVPQLFVRQAIVMDYSVYQRFRRSTSHTIQQYTLELLNLANVLLKPLNVTTVVVGIRVFTSTATTPHTLRIDKDLPPNSLDFVPVFTRWSDTQLNQTLSFDSAAFITDNGWNSTTDLGAAYLTSICSHNESGFVMKIRPYLSQMAGLFAHELGHQLGLTHNDKWCHCPNLRPAGGCLMDTNYGLGIIQRPVAWSNCSMHRLRSNYRNGWITCLRRPEPTPAGPSCGNGYLEGDEQCDCGPAADCQDKCCNATTCRLVDGAVCSSGPCCDQTQCQYRASSHVCRPAVPGGCDVQETCTGNNNSCPADLHEPAGIPCNGSGLSKGYCNRGLCRNRDDQCKRVWSVFPDRYAQARSAPIEPCYHTCISHPVTTDCELNLCLNLVCLSLDDPQPARYAATASDNSSCTYFISAVYQGPENVDDYSSCGEDMWCQSNQCVPIPDNTGGAGGGGAGDEGAGRETLKPVTQPFSSQCSLLVAEWHLSVTIAIAMIMASGLC